MRTRRRLTPLGTLLALTLLAGCVTGPETRPPPDAPTARFIGKWQGEMRFASNVSGVVFDLAVKDGKLVGTCAVVHGEVAMAWRIVQAWPEGDRLTFIAETEFEGKKARTLFQCRLQGGRLSGTAEYLTRTARIRLKRLDEQEDQKTKPKAGGPEVGG